MDQDFDNSVREMFDYNPDTGILTRKKSAGWINKSRPVGKVNKEGYIAVQHNWKYLLAHRLIWFIWYGYWPDFPIDHKDGNRANNAIANLQKSSSKHNGKNIGIAINNKSGITGVCWIKSDELWQAHISSDGNYEHIGRFKSLLDAAAARRSAEIRLGFSELHGVRQSYTRSIQQPRQSGGEGDE